MLFIITIFYSIINVLYQKYIKKYICMRSYYYYLFLINKYVLNWSIEIESNYKNNNIINNNIHNNTPNKILVCSNHPKILDGFFICKYLLDKYPEHTVLFIVKKDLIKLPVVGTYIKNNFICIERNFKNDESYIINEVNKYKLIYDKLIIVIFPEGTTMCKETIDRSNNWCELNNIQKYKNVLCPRISGIKLINDIFKPDLILNNTIYYLDDIYQNKTLYEKDLLNLNVIHRSKIIEDILPNNIDFEKDLYNIWRNKDELLEHKYIELQNLYNIINKYYTIHPNLIKKNDLMYQTSKLFLLFVPIAFLCHGYIYALNTFIVFITSYLYHKYNAFKDIDVISSCTLIFLSYYYMSNMLSLILMTIGIISYFIGKLFDNYFNMYDISIFFHNLLHIFCAMHIIIEFIMQVFL
jgi:hypothetical protein